MSVRTALNCNDATTAERLSEQAKKLGYWAIGVGSCFCALSIILIVVVYAVLFIPIIYGDHGGD